MRTLACLAATAALLSCSSPPPPAAPQPEPTPPAPAPGPHPGPVVDAPTPPPAATETLAADTPRTTVKGATFIAPAGWTLTVRGNATILGAPEGDSHIALIDVEAKDADGAVALGWQAYKPDATWKLHSAATAPDKDGWTDQKNYDYITSPNEQRGVAAAAMRRGAIWTVVIYDMKQGTAQKRLAQVALIFDRLLPPGHERESFAGRKAHPLDAARIAELGKFVDSARTQLQVPGVAIGLIQDGKVVFAGGFGVRELGKKQPVDADTLFIIASNTKAMTTLMLGKLVDEGKLTWETPVTDLLPSFRLDDDATTKQVKVKHLVCACTGLPRQDLEWLINFERATPSTEMNLLANVKPTTKFGEMFQYSNLLAAAGGFVGGFVLFPQLELGAAYDKAMQTRVFGPLGMKATTFDFKRAMRGNHASAHALDIDGKAALAYMPINHAIVPLRPAGGAWSNVRDVLRYVQMELALGELPNGTRYISKEALLARRAAQVTIGKDLIYGMGLEVDTTYGIPVVSHGGSMIGYKTDMIWLPDHQVGAVILTNSDLGQAMLGPFKRRLLEILFDGKPEAEAAVASTAKVVAEQIAVERKRLTVPADPAAVAKLAAHYYDSDLGDLDVTRAGDKTLFTVGQLRSEMATRVNPDGTTSFITIVPGLAGFELVAGDGKLLLHDAQHEYEYKAGPREPPGECAGFGSIGLGRGPDVSDELKKADALAEKDRDAGNAAQDKKQYVAAARHFLACARRYRGIDDDRVADSCYSSAINAFGLGNRLAKEGRAVMVRAAKDDPKHARHIYSELATASDCNAW